MARFTGWRPTRGGILLAVGIIVMVALVWGGLYVAKERGEQARREEAVKVAEERLRSDTEEGVALNDPDETTDQTEEQEADTTPGTTEQTPAPSTTELPATGPTETAAVLGVALMVFSAVSYVRSRKALM